MTRFFIDSFPAAAATALPTTHTATTVLFDDGVATKDITVTSPDQPVTNHRWQRQQQQQPDSFCSSDSSSGSTSSDDNDSCTNVCVEPESANELVYSEDDDNDEDDDDSDSEDELPHPLGFETLGQSRYSVDRHPKESMEAFKRRHGYINYFDEEYDGDFFRDTDASRLIATIPQVPPLSNYLDPRTAPTASLMQLYYRNNQKNHLRPNGRWHEKRRDNDDDDDIDKMTQLLYAAALVDQSQPALPHSSSSTLSSPNASRTIIMRSSAQELVAPYRAMQSDVVKIEREMELERRRLEQEHLEAARILQTLLQQNDDAAQSILREQARLDAHAQEEQRAAAAEAEKEQQRLHELEDERRRQEEKDSAEREKLRKEHEEEKKQQQLEAEKDKAAEEKAARESDFVGRAQKLVGQLVQMRASVKPFEESKDMMIKKRRLQIKKIVSGRVSTLAENVEKIRQIAAEVSQAIAEAREQDEHFKQQIAAGNTQIPPEMTKGKRYIVDLLSSNAMVRVQAEGHNG